MKKTKVVCVGEALIDRIKNKSNNQFTDFLGGAPANVACALRKLKIESAFIGRLGNDLFGKKFIEQFNALKVNTDFLQIDHNLPTRIVRVNRDKFGDRYFSGFDAGAHTFFADESIKRDIIEKDVHILEKLFKETKYFVTGTIVLSSLITSESIYYLKNIAKKFDVQIIVDLNWREVFWDYSNNASTISKNERITLIKKFLNDVQILKLAREEAILFFDNENPIEISKQIFSQPDVIVTDGANPISWFINGFEGTTAVINSMEIIDTTGAGDSFLAGFISKLISFECPLNRLEIETCIKFASVCGLITCLGEGAIEKQPNYREINEFLGSHIL